ncbi:MAG: nuclear transport factor 2 family protein [Betaproteobacteria bacterium]|nr:nuclear transport factor 2 family protein [Betaproteobacteria bacterium]
MSTGGNDNTLATRIDRIEARHALNDLVANYFLRVDARTYDSLADLFTADGTFAFAHMKASGRAGLLEFWQRRIANYEFTYHYLHSHVITSIDLAANTATGIVTGHAEHAIDATCVLAALRYDDQYARENGVWRIRTRTLSTRYFLPWNEMASNFREGAVSGRPKDTKK